MTRGELRKQHVVHWEKMRWFVRPSITATDIDGGIFAGLYMVEVGDFMFFEFKHVSAKRDKESGQARSYRAFVEKRLKRADRFVWVRHDATGDNQVDIYPENIVHWYAFRGEDVEEMARGDDWESLAAYCHNWSES